MAPLHRLHSNYRGKVAIRLVRIVTRYSEFHAIRIECCKEAPVERGRKAHGEGNKPRNQL